MTELFGRQVAVGIDDLKYEDLRIDFKVTKTASSEPNSAKLKIYNLNRDRTGMVLSRKRDTLIRLSAGYSRPRLLFQGNPTKGGIELDDQGTDRVLKIEAQDGLDAYQKGRLFKSTRAETPIEDVVQEAVDAMDLPKAKIDVPGDRRLAQGITFNGRASDVLDRLAADVGARWSIQDGEIQFIPTGETSDRTAVVFSADNGNLIGQPSPQDDGIKFEGLLDGSVNPDDEVVLQSRDHSGLYKADKVVYQGSKWSKRFYVTVTAQEVS